MGLTMRIAKQAVKHLQIPSAAAKKQSKSIAQTLQAVTIGKSKNEKKSIIKLYETYISNPNNKNIESQLQKAIASSQTVENAAKSGGGIFDDLNRTTTTFALENQLIRPIRIHNTFSQLQKESCEALRKTLADIPAPEIKIDTKELARRVIEESRKETLTLAGRRLKYPINKVLSQFINKDKRKLLAEVTQLPKEEFGAAYYKKLLEAKNLTNVAPTEINILPKSARMNIYDITSNNKYKCEGGFNLMDNTISFTKEFNTLPKAIQANLIRHELKHFEQIDQTIRTFGVERYIQALKQNNLNNLKASKEFIGKSDKELMAYIENSWENNKLEETIRKAFANSINGTKIGADTEIGKQAAKYLDSIENYSGLGKDEFYSNISNEYLSSLLEKEAYKTGTFEMIRTYIMNSLNLSSL